MKRDIEQDLKEWKGKKARKPLLVRGARQVGKSYTITSFGKSQFGNLVILNFDRTPEIHKFFSSELDPQKILRDLSLFYGVEIVPSNTLVFFDEIQECPRAIEAMRYFYEEMPELHLIGAGSLIEFCLHREDFKAPVGRVEYLWMKPMSFGEFLTALGYEELRIEIQRIDLKKPLSEPLHKKLLELLKNYALAGGMPAPVSALVQRASFREIKDLQESLLRTFRDDFGKYASRACSKYLDKVFLTAPRLVGKKFKYSHVESAYPIRDIKNALELLIEAGLFYKVRHSTATGLPLESETSEKKFKVVFFDAGLMQHLAGLEKEIHLASDIASVHVGSVAEQIAGQELLAYGPRSREGRLYFWTREERGSSAEVDYLFPFDSSIYPLEVKSSSPGRLKSLRLFMSERKTRLGIRTSSLSLSFQDDILSVPIYALEGLPALISSLSE